MTRSNGVAGWLVHLVAALAAPEEREDRFQIDCTLLLVATVGIRPLKQASGGKQDGKNIRDNALPL